MSKRSATKLPSPVRGRGALAGFGRATREQLPSPVRGRGAGGEGGLHRLVAAVALTLATTAIAWGAEPQTPDIVARDPAGHGLLCRLEGKTILMVEGTPEQMGSAHGKLLGQQAKKLTERVLYLMGGLDTIQGDKWFLDRMAEIERRTLPHMPERFLAECDAASKAAGISKRDGRYANLFPERFHCSGVAVRGKASRDGRVYHARVLDYMRDINLQGAAAVVVFMPKGYHKWMSLGYAGFLGTVTAMNERGLAVGEMGGRGEGDWDGMPMTFLLRDIMERASTVEEALEILRKTPRTCEYYYVFSDKSRNMAAVRAVPGEVLVLRPGQQHDILPHVPEDTVLVSGDNRAKVLSRRLQDSYGKIDAKLMQQIIKRPVAMRSNLHNAIFAPESLEMWFADAGKHTPACDEPYVRVNLGELIRFYEKATSGAVPVQGRVTFGGGDWPKSGVVYFMPAKAAAGRPRHPGSARFGADGRFTVESAEGKGLEPGEYRISIECWERPPSMENPAAAKSYVPDKYRNYKKSGLQVTVERGQPSIEFEANIPNR